MSTTAAPGGGPTIQEQAPVLLTQAGGYVGHRTVAVGLLTRHGFTDLGSFTLSPMHAVTYGRRPRW